MRVSQLDSWYDRKRRGGLNLGDGERAFSAIAGGALILFGLQKRGVPGVISALSGLALIQRGVSGHCALYDRLGVNTAHHDAAQPHDYFERGIHVEESVTIQRPLQELFDFWRNLENLPKFMSHVKRVQVMDPQHSHWVVHGPAGKDVEWDAEVINEDPGRLIAWKSLPGAEVDNAGSVHFREAPGRGTELRVTLEYLPPAGKLGLTVAKLMGEAPGQQIREDLRRLREIMETSAVPTTDSPPTGRSPTAPMLKGSSTVTEVASRLTSNDQPVHAFGRREQQPPQRGTSGEPIKEQLNRFENEGGPPAHEQPRTAPDLPTQEKRGE